VPILLFSPCDPQLLRRKRVPVAGHHSPLSSSA
jgi:hypothetical protein